MSQVTSATSSPQEPDINLSGQTLGDFLLLRRLGRGGMADVYLAEQHSLRRQVAVKILRAELARDPQYVSRFKFEAQAAARLVHANIVQVYNVGEVDGLQFIAQEYVKGQNLKQYLQRHGAVDVPVAVNLMSQVAAALARAAEEGVTHRDIKPENILLAVTGEAKVADFGLARVRDDAHRNHQTQIDVTMGTPLYMSPEQVEGRKVDPRSDLYSLGVTAYEMLAGRTPFEGGNALSVAIRHLQEEATPIEEIRPDVPATLGAIIRRLMAKRPEERYSSASLLVKDLRQLALADPNEVWGDQIQRLEVADHPGPTSQLAVTQQLERVMRREQAGTQATWGRQLWRFVSVGVIVALAALGVGVAAASLVPPRDPLQIPERGLAVPRQGSVEEQLRFALRNPDESRFLAVEKFWPRTQSRINDYYANLADVHLAEFYLQNEEFSFALERYRRLQNLAEQERRFLVVSYVGQAVVQMRRERTEDARDAMRRLDELIKQIVGHDEEPSLVSKELKAMLDADRRDLGFAPISELP